MDFDSQSPLSDLSRKLFAGMKIVYLTAGAAGMYCGSCLQDNALAKALIGLGHDTLLVPTYTPILTDESNISQDRLFYGGLNVYLQQISPIFRWVPGWADGFLSSPKLVNWIASRAMGTSAKNLGALTVSMLQGKDGRQSKEVNRLCKWLKTESPDVVVFSNLLIAGCIPAIRQELGVPTAVILQGDDIFYDGLIEPYREQSLRELRRLAQDVTSFIVHSEDYGGRMAQMLEISPAKIHVSPLSIDLADFAADPVDRSEHPAAIGYLARLAPEKGLHLLVDAFIGLAEQLPELRLEIAGWLGQQHHEYWSEQKQKLVNAGLENRFRYHGSVDREGKLSFLQSIDLLSVPTPYQEPKGRFVLEALAAGVPFLQPAHGAFPEIHARLGGGRLCEPSSTPALQAALLEMLQDRSQLRQFGSEGRSAVFDLASTDAEAKNFVEILENHCVN